MAGHSPVSLIVCSRIVRPRDCRASDLGGYSAASATGGTTEIKVRPPVVLRNFT
jgi:hypothetical protein